MPDEIDSQLSRFADGDLDRERASFLVHRLSQDRALKAKWSRLHLIKAVLRDQSEPNLRSDFAASVMQRLDEVPSTPRALSEAPILSTPSAARWRRPVAGFALAASVGAAMVGGVWLSQPQPSADLVSAAAVSTLKRDPRRVAEAALVQPIVTQSAMAGDGAQSAQLFGSELSAYLVQQRSVSQILVNGQPTPVVLLRRSPELSSPVSAAQGQFVSERR